MEPECMIQCSLHPSDVFAAVSIWQRRCRGRFCFQFRKEFWIELEVACFVRSIFRREFELGRKSHLFPAFVTSHVSPPHKNWPERRPCDPKKLVSSPVELG